MFGTGDSYLKLGRFTKWLDFMGGRWPGGLFVVSKNIYDTGVSSISYCCN